MREFFKLKIWKTSFVVISTIVLVSSAVVFYELKKEVKISQAGAGHNVLGFAWSENIGWISFNSDNCDTDNNGFIDTDATVLGCGGDNSTDVAFDYGVNVDLAGNVSGYAWSENIGWISFEPADIVGCPAGICQPSLAGGIFSGWARALNHGGGWDGWISLNCVNSGVCAASNYKVCLNSINFEGWAWGGDVVGWVSFNCSNNVSCVASNYKVYFRNNPPVITDGGWSMVDVCLLGANPQAQFTWGYTDDDPPQKDYQVEIGEITLPSKYDSGKILSSSNVFTVPPTDIFGAAILEYGKEYWYTVKAWDSNDVQSNILSCNFDGLKTITHQYPTATFTYLPLANITPLQEVIFDPSLSQVYDGSPALAVYDWDFDYDGTDPLEPSLDATTSPAPADPMISHFFAEVKTYEVNLKVTDSSGCSCMINKPVNVGGADLPKWNEVKP